MLTVKNWFLNKNFDANERIAIANIEPTVEKETEKAVFLCWNTSYGKIKKWIPKSCTEETTVKVEVDNTEIKTATTRDGRTLDVISDDGTFVVLSDGKTYAKFTLKF